jgi:hypothetical protein
LSYCRTKANKRTLLLLLLLLALLLLSLPALQLLQCGTF